LDRQLDVIESCGGDGIDQRRLEADPGGDHVGVEAGRVSMRDEIDDIAPQQGLAAREIDVQHAQRRGLVDQPLPLLGRQFLRAPVEFQRVRAIGTAQRAAMREFGQEPHRRRQRRLDRQRAGQLFDMAHRSIIL
jgi:hypothetical protein